MAKDLTQQPKEFEHTPIFHAWRINLVYWEAAKRGFKILREVDPFEVSPQPLTQYLAERKIYVPWQSFKVQREMLREKGCDCKNA